MGVFSKKISTLWESIIASLVIAFIIPLVFLLRTLITGGEYKMIYFLLAFAFSFTVSFCIYFSSVNIVLAFQNNEKSFRSPVYRIALEIAITTAVAAVIMSAVFFVFNALSDFEPGDQRSALFDNIVIAMTVNLVTLIIVETLFYINKWKQSIIESEKLRRQNIESQYAALTSQINPHFLFNSLNTLSSLISEDSNKALKFNKEFSKIYRYVLETKDKYLVTLREELDFINSYLFLQKIRFDKSLVYKTEIDYTCFEFYLPPLSLQLLVENVIKHNQISERSPLEISISGTGRLVTVCNNYQPYSGSAPAGGLGLKNLSERYSHFTDVKPSFRVENNNYLATIPLIEDE